MSRRSPPQQDGPSGGGGVCGTGRRSNPASSASRKDPAAAQNHQLQQLLAEAMASLQLPQPVPQPGPPKEEEAEGAAAAADEAKQHPAPALEHPTITLLVVADIDLASASELSEYALRHRLHIDLCIACGSFCRDEDLARMAVATSTSSSSPSPTSTSVPASFGRNDEPQRGEFVNQGNVDGVSAPIDRAMAGGHGGLRSIMALSGPNKSQSPNCWYPRRSAPTAAAGAATDSNAAETSGGSERCGWDATPLFRTREHTSALEGLMTATLSQLENIVCRVVYCPGSTDPITSILGQEVIANNEELGVHHQHPRRYTPNSRNLHRQWLPVAPGLGTAALLYLDCSDDLVHDATAALVRWSSAPGGGSHSKNKRGVGGLDGDRHHDDDEDEDEEDDEDNEANENIALWIEQLQQLKQQCQGYRSKLERLLTLAPPAQHVVSFAQPTQTILVTHYVDCTPFLAASDKDLAASTPMTASPVHYYTLPQQSADKRSRRRASRPSPPVDQHPVNGAPPWAFESTDEKAVAGDVNDDDHEEEEEEDNDGDKEAELNPWPTEHEAFRATPLAQQRMCLEIASGCPVRRPEVRTTGPNQTVLIPGSLRERGEFSVVQVSLRETPSSPDQKRPTPAASATTAGPSPPAGVSSSTQQDHRGATATTSGAGGERRTPKASSMKPSSTHKRTFSWVVQHVDFHRLNERKA